MLIKDLVFLLVSEKKDHNDIYATADRIYICLTKLYTTSLQLVGNVSRQTTCQR